MNMVKPLPSGQHPMVSASVSYFIVIIWVDLSWLTCTIRQRYPFISTLIQWNIRTTHIVRNMYILIHYKALSYCHCFPDGSNQGRASVGVWTRLANVCCRCWLKHIHNLTNHLGNLDLSFQYMWRELQFFEVVQAQGFHCRSRLS